MTRLDEAEHTAAAVAAWVLLIDQRAREVEDDAAEAELVEWSAARQQLAARWRRR